MALLNLTTETMVMVADQWLDAKKQRKLLTSLPLVAPLVPILEKARDDLMAKQQTGSSISAQIGVIQKEQATRDKRHDRKLRGTHGLLTALADLADDEESVQGLLDLRDRLIPIGPRATQRSYLDQAGDAKLLPSRLDAASTKLLGKVPTPDGALQVHVDAWLEEAHTLGVLEEKREVLAQQVAEGEQGPSRAETLEARHAWIRAVRALEANLALDQKATEDQVEAILRPLRRAEAKADRRKGYTPEADEEVSEVPAAAPVEPDSESKSPPG